jgi:putative transposase
MNPRVTFDGLNWWISVGIEVGDLIINKEVSEPLGIDLGIKDLAIVSNGQTFTNINKGKSIRKLKKKLKRLQKQVSRKYEETKKRKEDYKKTKNIIKLENKIRGAHQKLTNIRTNYIHQITTSLVKTKPEYIVIEDLNIQDMMKNKHLSKAIQEHRLFDFKTKI